MKKRKTLWQRNAARINDHRISSFCLHSCTSSQGSLVSLTQVHKGEIRESARLSPHLEAQGKNSLLTSFLLLAEFHLCGSRTEVLWPCWLLAMAALSLFLHWPLLWHPAMCTTFPSGCHMGLTPLQPAREALLLNSSCDYLWPTRKISLKVNYAV